MIRLKGNITLRNEVHFKTVRPLFIHELNTDLESYWSMDNGVVEILSNHPEEYDPGHTYETDGIIDKGVYKDGEYVVSGQKLGQFMNITYGRPSTVNFWINSDVELPGDNAGIAYILFKAHSRSFSTTKGWGLRTIYTSRNKLEFFVVSNQNHQRMWFDWIQTPGTWQMITLTYDGTNTLDGCNVYINSTQTTKSGVNMGLTASSRNTDDLHVGGAYVNADDRQWSDSRGKYDEIGFWNKVLTKSEIDDLYNSGSSYQYPFGELPKAEQVQDLNLDDIRDTKNPLATQTIDLHLIDIN